MKISGREAYLERLSRVVDYIYDHLEDEIDLNRLADVACLSPFHWHRIYTAMQGETVAATVKRLRLQRAADRLANSDAALQDVARRAGYGSVAAFSRAFKEVYLQSPSAYRASGSHARFKSAAREQDARGFEVTIESRAPLSCASVRHEGSYLQIDRAMATLFHALTEQREASANGARMFGVFYDDPDAKPESLLQSRACTPVQDRVPLRPPLESIVLQGGRYARLQYQGPYADMKNAYQWLFGTWLPESGFGAANAPNFEEYLSDPRTVPPTQLHTDIWLPIEDEV